MSSHAQALAADRPPHDSAADDGVVAVLQAIRRMMRAVDLHSHTLARKYGLTGPQMIVMQSLKRSGEMSAGQIARVVHLSQATVTGIVQRLVKQGCVTSEKRSDDRRRVIVTLTAEGAAVLDRAPEPLQEQFNKRFALLEDWEQTQLLSSLQRVVAMLEAEDIDASPMLATGPVDATSTTTEDFLGGGESASSALPRP